MNLSSCLDDYLLNWDTCLSDYEILEKNQRRENSVIFKGRIKNSSQSVKIYKRRFKNDEITRKRFFALMDALEEGIILADTIFLSKDPRNLDNDYYIFTVEPWSSGIEEKYLTLEEYLRKGDLCTSKKKVLFLKLVDAVRKLHKLGVVHGSLCPKNVWVEDATYISIRPFALSLNEHEKISVDKLIKALKNSNKGVLELKKSKQEMWYKAPEMVFETSEYRNSLQETTKALDFKADMWSLGCIFSDMFISLTPIFQVIETRDLVFRFIEVLGIPSYEEASYMEPQMIESLKFIIEQDGGGELNEKLLEKLLNSLTDEERDVLSGLLRFKRDDRLSCERLMKQPFFNYLNHSGNEITFEGEDLRTNDDSNIVKISTEIRTYHNSRKSKENEPRLKIPPTVKNIECRVHPAERQESAGKPLVPLKEINKFSKGGEYNEDLQGCKKVKSIRAASVEKEIPLYQYTGLKKDYERAPKTDCNLIIKIEEVRNLVLKPLREEDKKFCFEYFYPNLAKNSANSYYRGRVFKISKNIKLDEVVETRMVGAELLESAKNNQSILIKLVFLDDYHKARFAHSMAKIDLYFLKNIVNSKEIPKKETNQWYHLRSPDNEYSEMGQAKIIVRLSKGDCGRNVRLGDEVSQTSLQNIGALTQKDEIFKLRAKQYEVMGKVSSDMASLREELNKKYF